MNMKKIIVELSSSWTLANADGGVDPASKLVEKLKSILPASTEYAVDSFTVIDIVIDAELIPVETAVDKITAAFVELFGAESQNAITISVENQEKTADEIAPSADKKEGLTPSEGGVSKFTFDTSLTSGDSSSASTQEGADVKPSIMKEIDELIAGEDFKELAHELAAIAPHIIQNKTYDVFTYQSYIFSINEGCGLSTYLDLFAKLVYELKLKKISTMRPVVEWRLPEPTPERPMAALSGLVEFIDSGKARDCILCLDISEWMSHMEGETFRYLLSLLNKLMERYIVVFRVPYVENDVLERVRLALSDLIFVRTLSFPPFSKEELQLAAAKEIEKYGFKMSNYAWNSFHERVAEEKRDGRFYGINTVKKIVRELLYKKQLSNAKKGKSDMMISKRDAKSLTTTEIMEGVDGMEQLKKLVGSEAIVKQVEELLLQIEFARSDASGAMKSPCMHMRFVGNPGTGKTTVARIIGKILKDKGVLRIGGFHEHTGRDFCGRFVGETAPKTAGMCRDAYGSILFIDEAYTLYRDTMGGADYGREALDTLIAEMENHRDDFVVIMAGYTDDMETLMKGNAGLAGRMPYMIEFPNFTKEQLYEIFVTMLEKCKYTEELLTVAKEYFMALSDEVIKSKEFSNARFVRNLYERTWAKALRRCQFDKKKDVVLDKEDFEQASSEKSFKDMLGKKQRTFGFYE